MSQIRMNKPGIRSEIVALPELNELQVMWRALEGQARGSFFTSWGFIGPLLKLAQTPPDLFIARDADAVVGLALIADRTRNSLFGKIRGLCLNQTGNPAEDLVYIEYNDVLHRSELRPEVLAALARELETRTTPWAELGLAGITNEQLKAFIIAFGLNETERKTTEAPFVELEAVRTQGHLPLLSGNTRRQITRSKRLFEEKFGPLALRRITNETDVRADVAMLADLQTTQFDGSPAPSSFRSPFFTRFIETLILSEPTDDTGADLLRIEAGQKLLGLLVNFSHKGALSNYQCAFTPFPENNQLKPGLVSHSLAIEYYAAEGAEIYHFLGGDQQYKKSLSTGADQMIWTRLQKPDPRLKLETVLKSVKARIAP